MANAQDNKLTLFMSTFEKFAQNNGKYDYEFFLRDSEQKLQSDLRKATNKLKIRALAAKWYDDFEQRLEEWSQ